MAHMVKSKFASLLRSLLRRMDAPAPPPRLTVRPVASAAPAAAAPAPAQKPLPVPVAPPNANEISLPLTSVIAALSPDLRAKAITSPPPGTAINLSVETILPQLAFGAVKVSFGELRQLAGGFLGNSGDGLDNKMVSLPLGEILPRLNPAMLTRRTAKKVEVAEDINGPFGGRGAGLAFTTQPLKAPAAAPAPPPPTPAPEPAPLRVNPPFVPPKPAAPIAFAPPPNLQRQSAPVPMPAAQPFRPPTSTPPASIPAPAMPKISAAPIAAPAMPVPEAPTIFATLNELSEIWPDELKDEISRAGLSGIKVPLTGNLVEAGLKRGRLTLPWKQLRTLAAPNSAASPNDNLELELPLKVITPLFFAAQKNLQRPKAKATVVADIPNLFFGFPQAAPEPPTSAPKPAEKQSSDSNFFTRSESGDTKAEKNPFLAPPVPQTDFTHRQAQPRDIVTRAMQLPGVAGALVALPDGLRVAGEVPAEFNADTMAAFIPQLFERMNQSAKELRMGALNNVSFTVGNVPWRIIRVNSVYFAAFGRAGETLPSAQLASLASELDRKRM